MVQVIRVFSLAAAAVAAALSPLVVHRPHEAAAPRTSYAQVAYLSDEREAAAQQVQAAIDERAAAAAQARADEAAAAAAKAAADAAAQAAADAAARAAAQRRATPIPLAPALAPAVNYGSGPIQDIIRNAFAPYGQTAVDWGLRVAKCESGYNPRAYNPAGPYYGLFQFLMSTFKGTPYGNQDIYDPYYNAAAAAWKYGNYGGGAWGCN